MNTNLTIGTKVKATTRLSIRHSNIHVLPGDTGEVVAVEDERVTIRFDDTNSVHSFYGIDGVAVVAEEGV